jgi:hypothetical protein
MVGNLFLLLLQASSILSLRSKPPADLLAIHAVYAPVKGRSPPHGARGFVAGTAMTNEATVARKIIAAKLLASGPR